MNTQHNPNVCGWDFDDLADRGRGWERNPKLVPAADELRDWFTRHGLDMDELGDGEHLTEADAFDEWGPA